MSELPAGDIAARRVWIGIAPDGVEREIELCVFVPQPRDNDWYANVSLGELDPGRVMTIYGVDSWQAMNLAQRFIETMIASYEKGGWQFFWSPDGESATARQLGINDISLRGEAGNASA